MNTLKDACVAIKQLSRIIHAARLMGLEVVQKVGDNIVINFDNYNNASLSTRSWNVVLGPNSTEAVADHLDDFMLVANKAQEFLEAQIEKSKAAKEVLNPFFLEEKLNPKDGKR